jgi:hypothetical protein
MLDRGTGRALTRMATIASAWGFASRNGYPTIEGEALPTSAEVTKKSQGGLYEALSSPAIGTPTNPMMRSKITQFAAAALFAAASVGAARATTYTVSLTGTARSISPNFYGENATERNSFDWEGSDGSETFKTAFQGLGTTLLRIPTGTGANYWDWNSGKFISNYSGYTPQPNTYPSPLSELQKEVDFDSPAASADYVLNALTDPTLSGTDNNFAPWGQTGGPNLNYQLSLISQLQTMGWDITLFELGNEYYLSGQAGYTTVYTDSSAGGFTDGAGYRYGQLANSWIAQIHSTDGNAKVAVVGRAFGSTDPGTQPERDQCWNAGVFAACTDADACVFHVYQPSNLPAGRDVENATDAANMLAQPFMTWTGMEATDLPSIPSGMNVRVTEYNLQDGNSAAGSWCHALYLATLSLEFLGSAQIQHAMHYTTVEQAGHGELFNGTDGFAGTQFVNHPATTEYGLSASGLMSQLLNLASVGQDSAQQLSFGSNVPMIHDSNGDPAYPALYGWRFTGSGTNELLILNLDSSSLTVDLSGIVSSGSFEEIYGNAWILVTNGLSGGYPTAVSEKSGAISNVHSCTLQPYSISLVTY